MRPCWRIFCAVACLIATGCASDLRPSRDGKPDTGGVEGVIVDNAHRGIRNTNITILTNDPIPRELGAATTDYTGRFVIERIPAGNDRVLRAQKTGTASVLRATLRQLSIVGGKVRDLGEIELTAGAQ